MLSFVIFYHIHNARSNPTKKRSLKNEVVEHFYSLKRILSSKALSNFFIYALAASLLSLSEHTPSWAKEARSNSLNLESHPSEEFEFDATVGAIGHPECLIKEVTVVIEEGVTSEARLLATIQTSATFWPF